MFCVSNVTVVLYLVGAIYHLLYLFENIHPIPRGVSYNSYLLLDEKNVLFDTVDWAVCRQFLENIKAVLQDKPLDYIVINHIEPDHGASLQEVLNAYPNATVICTDKAKTFMDQFGFRVGDRVETVKEGDTKCFGKHTVSFIAANMIHWPEVMVAYEKKEKILFSADAFGKFGALDVEDEWDCEARRYYINIVGKYGAQVQALLKKAATLDIQKIFALHGPMLTENLGYYINKYDIWSSYRPEDEGILIAYASVYGHTKQAAEKLKEILEAKGAPKVAITDLARDDMAEAVEDAFRYDRLVLASVTYDGGIFPCMESFIAHLKSKNYQNRKVAFIENGSWAPIAAKKMRAELEGLKNLAFADTTVSIKSAMKEADIKQLEALADELLVK